MKGNPGSEKQRTDELLSVLLAEAVLEDHLPVGSSRVLVGSIGDRVDDAECVRAEVEQVDNTDERLLVLVLEHRRAHNVVLIERLSTSCQ